MEGSNLKEGKEGRNNVRTAGRKDGSNSGERKGDREGRKKIIAKMKKEIKWRIRNKGGREDHVCVCLFSTVRFFFFSSMPPIRHYCHSSSELSIHFFFETRVGVER